MEQGRKRIKGEKVAWSNGERTVVPPSQLKILEHDYYRRLDEYHRRVMEGREWDVDEEAVMRGDSRLMEEYSDRLWELDMHVECMRWLIQAARELIDWNIVCLDHYEVSYYHRNLRRFRYLVHRCQARCEEDPWLRTMLERSSVYEDYRMMERMYANDKVWGLAP
jgi:hypothetical protein